MLQMTISTSVWGAQHPNAGRNIQQFNVTELVLPSSLKLLNWIIFQWLIKIIESACQFNSLPQIAEGKSIVQPNNKSFYNKGLNDKIYK